MIYEPSWLAVAVFVVFVGITLKISFYLGSKAQSAQGYFAAHGQIPWFVNGIAFAGDYLSAASFLGICGMIAFYGYDGFLYSIGYLAGWVVALFVIAEPMKRLGKFTFADALDAKFHSRGIKLSAGISTLVVSIFYLIPQMVGAGALVQPLLGLPHWAGVLLVGATVMVIVVSAGMVSTTWVQFLKGSLLVIFSAVLTLLILNRGLETRSGGVDGHVMRTLGPLHSRDLESELRRVGLKEPRIIPPDGGWLKENYVRTTERDVPGVTVWSVTASKQGSDDVLLAEGQMLTKSHDGRTLVNGQLKGKRKGEPELHPVGYVSRLPDGVAKSGPLGLWSFFSTLQESEVVLWGSRKVVEADGGQTTVYFQKPTSGRQLLQPGEHPTFQGIRSQRWQDKLNLLSLMLALFCGTASLPHILIRYYTVRDEASARKSTIVGIASIGFFYVLTLYMGLGP